MLWSATLAVSAKQRTVVEKEGQSLIWRAILLALAEALRECRRFMGAIESERLRAIMDVCSFSQIRDRCQQYSSKMGKSA